MVSYLVMVKICYVIGKYNFEFVWIYNRCGVNLWSRIRGLNLV